MRDWIPSATRNVFKESTLRWKRDPAIICDHTTEGAGFPSKATYKNGDSAPHITTHPRARQTQQHTPFSRAAYALKAPAGISTNTMGVIQVEIVGTCEDRLRGEPHSVYSFTRDELQYLADIHGEISDATGIPLVSQVTWESYPRSYGLVNGVRLTPAQFYEYTGVLGHQHVPGNEHGDPGSFIPKMLDLTGPPQPDVPEFVVEEIMRGDLIQSPTRSAVVDINYWKTLDPEEYPVAQALVQSKTIEVNERQFDLARGIALYGEKGNG